MEKLMTELRIEFGSLYRMAKLMNLTPNAIYQWQARKNIPLKYIKEIERLTEGRIDRKKILPAIFGE